MTGSALAICDHRSGAVLIEDAVQIDQLAEGGIFTVRRKVQAVSVDIDSALSHIPVCDLHPVWNGTVNIAVEMISDGVVVRVFFISVIN